MVALNYVLDNWEKMEKFITSSVFLELSTDRQIILAKRAMKAYRNGVTS